MPVAREAVMSARPALSVVVPLYNEEESVGALVDAVRAALGGHGSWELVLVDDGSRDGTAAVAHSLAAADGRIRLMRLARNYGQTQAMQAGFAAAEGDVVVSMDGDLQNDPADIGTLLPHVKTFDLVCGWRTNRHDSLVRTLSSRIANAVRSVVTGDRVHDTGCSLKIFRRAVVDKLQLFNGMHRFFPALALMHGFTVTEVPVRHYPRTHGLSKYGVGNRLFKSLYDLIAVRWMQTRVLRYTFRDK